MDTHSFFYDPANGYLIFEWLDQMRESRAQLVHRFNGEPEAMGIIGTDETRLKGCNKLVKGGEMGGRHIFGYEPTLHRVSEEGCRSLDLSVSSVETLIYEQILKTQLLTVLRDISWPVKNGSIAFFNDGEAMTEKAGRLLLLLLLCNTGSLFAVKL